jgi:NitT/TauT family transport system substrate-binding protein
MMRSLRIFVAAMVALSAIGFVIFWTNDRNHSTREAPIRLGLSVWPGFGPFFIADEKGFFKRQKLDVQLNIFQDDSQRDASLLADRIDAIGMTVDSLAVFRHRGVDVKAIYKFDNSSGADGIVAKPDIHTIPDLKGKRVGWAPGTTSHFFLAVALSQAGLKTADLSHVALAADEAGTAFAAGQLDAAVTWEPWLTKAVETHRGTTLLTTRQLPVIEDVLFFRGSTLKNRHDDIVKFLRACFEAVDYWKAHPDEGSEIVAKRLGLSKSEVNKMLPNMRIVNYEDNVKFFADGGPGSPVYSAYQLATRIWIQEGVVKSRNDNPADATDSSFIRQVR